MYKIILWFLKRIKWTLMCYPFGVNDMVGSRKLSRMYDVIIMKWIFFCEINSSHMDRNTC
jgi:hypothetical protein